MLQTAKKKTGKVSKTDLVRTDLDVFKTSVDEKFKHVDTRFDRIDQKFDHMEHRFDEVGKRFDLMQKQIDNEMRGSRILLEEMHKQLTSVAQIASTVVSSQAQLQNHGIRIENLERDNHVIKLTLKTKNQ